MRSNFFKDRIIIEKKTATSTALGQSVIWNPAHVRFGRKVPVDAATRIRYQQNKSVVTHKLIFEGAVIIEPGTYRFRHNGNTYEPVEPAMKLADNTVIMVKET